MSIISEINNLTSSKASALTIARTIQDAHSALLGTFSASMSMIWDAEDSQAVVTELGVHAAAIFGASRACCICLETASPGCTTSILAKRGTFTVNPDGTITDVKKPYFK